jgi:hypothetical protein
MGNLAFQLPFLRFPYRRALGPEFCDSAAKLLDDYVQFVDVRNHLCLVSRRSFVQFRDNVIDLVFPCGQFARHAVTISLQIHGSLTCWCRHKIALASRLITASSVDSYSCSACARIGSYLQSAQFFTIFPRFQQGLELCAGIFAVTDISRIVRAFAPFHSSSPCSLC